MRCGTEDMELLSPVCNDYEKKGLFPSPEKSNPLRLSSPNPATDRLVQALDQLSGIDSFGGGHPSARV